VHELARAAITVSEPGRVLAPTRWSRNTQAVGEAWERALRDDIIQLWLGSELLRTVQRASTGPIRNNQPLGGVRTKTPRNTTD